MTASKPTSTKSFFDWIQPSMAADGLLVPAPWQNEHAVLAATEFTDILLQHTAMIIAALHPYVLDYIAQAPVLVLAAAGTSGDLDTRSARLQLATRFIATAGASHRLPHILRAWRLTPPMRRLAGSPLATTHHRLLAPLASMTETTLAQVIPIAGADQRVWLQWLDRLASHRWHHHTARNRFVAWAATNLRTHEQRLGSVELADWALFNAGRFDPAMTCEQARAASTRWHEDQATVRRARPTLHAADTRVIDYAPLPAEIAVDGLTFAALRSLADLEDESTRMHHCVRSYWSFVAGGRSRIYSIRRGDMRLATVELQRRVNGLGSPLALAQIKGHCNAKPQDDIATAAHRFLALANAYVIEAAKLKAAAAKVTAAGHDSQPRRGGGQLSANTVPDTPGLRQSATEPS